MPDGFTGSGAIVAASFDLVSRSPDSAAVASLASQNPSRPSWSVRASIWTNDAARCDACLFRPSLATRCCCYDAGGGDPSQVRATLLPCRHHRSPARRRACSLGGCLCACSCRRRPPSQHPSAASTASAALLLPYRPFARERPATRDAAPPQQQPLRPPLPPSPHRC